jgi:hypothetical protein
MNRRALVPIQRVNIRLSFKRSIPIRAESACKRHNWIACSKDKMRVESNRNARTTPGLFVFTAQMK